MGEWPGARSKDLQKDRERYLPRGMSSSMPVFASSGSGATLTDVDGNQYIDFATGISVMNVGHGHPLVLKAIRDQAEQLVHSGGPVMMPEVYVRLARRLCEITPGSYAKKALLLNSGAEAVENAVKVDRAAGDHQLSQQLSWPDLDVHDADREGLALPAELWPLRSRGLPGAVPL